MAVEVSTLATAPVNPVAHLTEYELRHTAAHLAEAGRADDLHRLLALETSEQRNAWYTAKEAHSDIDSYANDVERAWKLSEEVCEPWKAADAGHCVGLQVRYALAASSIGSLAGNVSSDLMLGLVDKGLWQPERAIAFMRQVADPEERVKRLAALADHLAGVRRELAIREALAATEFIRDQSQRAILLLRLASQTTEQDREPSCVQRYRRHAPSTMNRCGRQRCCNSHRLCRHRFFSKQKLPRRRSPILSSARVRRASWLPRREERGAPPRCGARWIWPSLSALLT